MNAQLTIIDPEQLEYLPAKTLLRLVEQYQRTQKHSKSFTQTVNNLPALFRALEELELEPRFDLDDGSISLSFAGDGPKLTVVWRLLRRHGYNTHSRPKKGDTTFYSFWECEGQARIFLNFTSSVCRRVQVGTQMVEQPIFETQCGEMPEIEAETPSVPVVVETSDDVPF